VTRRGAGWQRPAASHDDGIDPTPAASTDGATSAPQSADPPNGSAAGSNRTAPRPTPTLAFIFSVVITVAVAVGSGVFNAGPSEADVTSSYNDGFAAGAEATRADLEADSVARASAITDKQIREAELRGIHAGFDLGDELRELNFDDGYDFG